MSWSFSPPQVTTFNKLKWHNMKVAEIRWGWYKESRGVCSVYLFFLCFFASLIIFLDPHFDMYVYLPVLIQNKQSLQSKHINLKGREPEKGVLLSHTISDLRIPLSYEVRLAPITTYSTGDYISRIIQYSERKTHLKPFLSSVFVFSQVFCAKQMDLHIWGVIYIIWIALQPTPTQDLQVRLYSLCSLSHFIAFSLLLLPDWCRGGAVWNPR